MRAPKKDLVKEIYEPIIGQKDIIIDYCEESNRVRLDKRWVPPSKKFFVKKLTNALIIHQDYKLDKISFELDDHPLDHSIAVAHISGQFSNGKNISQDYEIQYSIANIISPTIQKAKSGQYYQGILQLRNPTPRALEILQTQLTGANKKGIFLSKEKKVTNGFDYYFSSNTFVHNVAHALQKQLGGALTLTSKLHSYDHQSSKELHRVTALLAFFPFHKGDLLKNDSNYFFVETIHTTATARDIHSKKKIHIKYEDSSDYEKLDKVEVTISSTSPKLFGIHPSTFQSEPIKSVTFGKTIPKIESNTINAWVVGDELFSDF